MHSVVAAGRRFGSPGGWWLARPGLALLLRCLRAVRPQGRRRAMHGFPSSTSPFDRSIEPDMHSRHMLQRYRWPPCIRRKRQEIGWLCVWRSSFKLRTALFFHRSRGSAGELRVGAFLAALLSS
ncbi:hypothetical protein GQ55_3G478800 [Panicum hallii var. hallii]|uniref:Secreted protein n=1 Tax=Panicum hallii var. hallii TaxID=1504633 RepID=A0A2T7EJJ5_9POAL|nr:hypothetical protein GQ55_3G478800 [Panicum hallii var. hallii]